MKYQHPVYWVDVNSLERIAKNTEFRLKHGGGASDFECVVLARYYSDKLRKAREKRDRSTIRQLIPKHAAFMAIYRKIRKSWKMEAAA